MQGYRNNLERKIEKLMNKKNTKKLGLTSTKDLFKEEEDGLRGQDVTSFTCAPQKGKAPLSIGSLILAKKGSNSMTPNPKTL